MSIAGEERLKVALDDLTAAMSAPVLSGELVEWFDTALGAAEALEQALVEQVSEIHPPIFKQISAEDQEMLSLVERLERTDEALLNDMRKFKEDLRHYRKAAERLEPKETFLQEPLGDLGDQWLRLFEGINKQEAGISTWLQEALQRDRGPVD